ncbi:hypothetical protein KAR34_04760, partial [bacterium]|nr:hypothetical protein [bacterium]
INYFTASYGTKWYLLRKGYFLKRLPYPNDFIGYPVTFKPLKIKAPGFLPKASPYIFSGRGRLKPAGMTGKRHF